MGWKPVDLSSLLRLTSFEDKGLRLTIDCPISNIDIEDVDAFSEKLLDGKVSFCDKQLVKLLGFPKDYLGKTLRELAEDNKHFRSVFRSLALNKLQRVSIEYTIRKRVVRIEAEVVKENENLAGVELAFFGNQKEKTSTIAQELFTSVFYGNPAATVLIDKTGRIININPQFTTLFGYTLDEVKGKDINKLLVPEGEEEEGRKLDTIAAKMGYINHEGMRRRKDGSLVPVLISGSPLILRGEMVGIIGTYFDISQLKKASEKISFLATHDSLTGLPNRHLLSDRFLIEKSQADRFGHKVAAFFIDVSRFKDINDVYGHEAGDVVLKEVADRLKRIMRGSDSIVRWGGDEFVIFADHLNKAEDIVSVAVKITSITEEPVVISGTSINIALDVGISVYPDDGTEVDELLRKADIAMYHAKAKGGNFFEFYSKKIEEARLRTISDLKMQEVRFKLVFEKSPFAACLVDSQGKVYRVNANFKKLVGKSVREIIGRRVSDIFAGRVGEELMKAVETTIDKREYSTEISFCSKDGRMGHFRVHCNTFPLLKQSENLVILDLVDITEIREYTRTIEEKERLVSAIIESSPLPMFVISKDHKVLYFNSAMEDLTGVRKSRILGKEYIKVVNPLQTRTTLADMVIDGQPLSEIRKVYPLSLRRTSLKRGLYVANDVELEFGKKRKVVDIFVAPITDESGQVVSAVEVIQDKTEQHFKESLIRASMEVVESAIATNSLRSFLDRVQKAIGKRMTVKNMFVALKEGEFAKIVYFRDEHDSNPGSVKLSDSLTGYVFRHGKPLLVNKEKLVRLSQEENFKIRGTISEYYLEVPLKIKKHMIGAIVIQSYSKEDSITQKDLKFIEHLSDEIALGVIGKESQESLERSVREKERALKHAKIFHDVIVSLEKEITLNELLAELLAKLKELIHYDTANIALLEDGSVRNIISVGYEKYRINGYEQNLVQDLKDLSEVRKAIRIKKPVLIRNTEKAREWVVFDKTKWIKSHLVSPIVVAGKVLGVLRLDSAKRGGFTKEHADEISTFSAAAAIAIRKTIDINNLADTVVEKEFLAGKQERLVKMYNCILRHCLAIERSPENSLALFVEALVELSQILNADAVFLYAKGNDGAYENVLHHVSDKLKGIERIHSIFKSGDFLNQLLPTLNKQLFVFHSSGISEGDATISKKFEKMGFSDVCILPILDAEGMHSFFGFAFTGKPGQISDEEITSLQLTAFMYSAWIEVAQSRKRQMEHIERIERILKETIYAIVKVLELRDPYTAGHSKRVASICEAISRELGLEDEKVSLIRTAAILHDIGKISVPSEILAKPTSLNDVEFEIVKSHCVEGARIIRSIKEFKEISRIVMSHHERMDGSGYPKGLKDGEIPLEARIIAVADVFEAMTSHRPYRAARTVKEAIEELKRNSGRLYDESVVEAFLRAHEKGKIK